MNKELLVKLVQQLLAGDLSTEEKAMLQEYILEANNRDEFVDIVNQVTNSDFDTVSFNEEKWRPIIEEAVKVDKPFLKTISSESLPADLQSTDTLPPRITNVHRIHFLKTAWFRYAAAVLIIFGIAAFLLTRQEEKPTLTKTENPTPVNTDVKPGGNRAILTLADGQQIVLDSVANGQVSAQKGSIVIKKADGQIAYQPNVEGGQQDNDVATTEVAYNTMSTPRGGQYQLRLPDGTEVWLNAASSITYPTAFTGKERKVSITGEVYFEVAKNARMRFIVSINDAAKVEVLGTHFNINAYMDEPSIQTTLLEGKVKVSTANSQLQLDPEQQAKIQDNHLTLNRHADIESVMAWKNGAFQFRNSDVVTLMRQLARWYDIEIVYVDGIPVKKISGKMGRNLNLTQVMIGMEALGLQTELRGKQLLVKGQIK